MPSVNASTSTTTALTTLFTCPTGKSAYVTGIRVTNVTTNPDTIDIQFVDSSASSSKYLSRNFPVPAAASIDIVDLRLVLEAGDSIRVRSNTNASIDIVSTFLVTVEV